MRNWPDRIDEPEIGQGSRIPAPSIIDVKPVPARDLTKPEERFELLSMMRGIDAVVSARVLDHKTEEIHRVATYEKIDTYTVINIDTKKRSLTLVDSEKKPTTLLWKSKSKR